MTETGPARLTQEVSELAEERSWPNQRPKDAATLMVLDRSGRYPKVLLGKRHDRHVFLPGKFVFPGGRLEPSDTRMQAMGFLHPRVEEALVAKTPRPSRLLGRGLALAALRETYEETGLMLGVPQPAGRTDAKADGLWRDFYARNILPDLGGLRLVGRAITPPRMSRRFDTRFFAIDREAVVAAVPGFTGPDKEFVETVWIELGDAQSLDLPSITAVMLEELESRIAGGFGHALPVPFYRELRGRSVREEV